MNILVLTTQRLDELSGINTYLAELVNAATLVGRSVKVFSVREISVFALWKEIGQAEWVHINTADPYSLLLSKIRRKRILARVHYTTWASTHVQKWVPWGFRKRWLTEIEDRWKQHFGIGHFVGSAVRLFNRTIVHLLADEVVGVSSNLTQSLELPRRTFTVYLPKALQGCHRPPPTVDRRKRILFCGCIDTGKGLFELMQALGELKAQGADILIRVAGEGPSRWEAEHLAKQLGVNHSIAWLGRLSQERVHEEMLSVAAVAVPSITNEPLGFTVLEAGTCFTPVIGSNRGGIPEAMGQGGWTVDPTDKIAFAEVLKEVWNSPEECRRRGVILHEHVAKVFDPVRSFQALCAVMENPAEAASFGAIEHRGKW